jgi:hypothetical protein
MKPEPGTPEARAQGCTCFDWYGDWNPNGIQYCAISGDPGCLGWPSFHDGECRYETIPPCPLHVGECRSIA